MMTVRFLAGYRRRAVIDRDLEPAVLPAAVQMPTIAALEGELVGRASARQGRPVVLHLLWSRLGTPICPFC